MTDVGPYDGFRLRNSGLPDPSLVVGWWRWRWTFELASDQLRPILIPPPVGDVDPFPAVVTSSWVVGGKLVVDCYSRGQVIPGDALTYVSVIAVWIQFRHGEREVLINGERRHSILRMSVLGEDVISRLEEAGY